MPKTQAQMLGLKGDIEAGPVNNAKELGPNTKAQAGDPVHPVLEVGDINIQKNPY